MYQRNSLFGRMCQPVCGSATKFLLPQFSNSPTNARGAGLYNPGSSAERSVISASANEKHVLTTISAAFIQPDLLRARVEPVNSIVPAKVAGNCHKHNRSIPLQELTSPSEANGCRVQRLMPIPSNIRSSPIRRSRKKELAIGRTAIVPVMVLSPFKTRAMAG
jgi:hypothetical protein